MEYESGDCKSCERLAAALATATDKIKRLEGLLDEVEVWRSDNLDYLVDRRLEPAEVNESIGELELTLSKRKAGA